MRPIETILAELSRQLPKVTAAFLDILIGITEIDAEKTVKSIGIGIEAAKQVQGLMQELAYEHRHELIEHREELIPILELVSKMNQASEEVGRTIKEINEKYTNKEKEIMKLFVSLKQDVIGRTLTHLALAFGFEKAESAEVADVIICDDPQKIRDFLDANDKATAIEYHFSPKEEVSRLCEEGHYLSGRVIPGFVLTDDGHPGMVIELIKKLAQKPAA